MLVLHDKYNHLEECRLNLKEMMETDCFNNVLELKKFLIEHKKSGRLFYLCDMATLNIEEEFELYFYISKSPNNIEGAFPVLRSVFEDQPNEEKLQRLYASYYDTPLVPEHKYFQRLSVFKGSEWVWLYDNQKLEAF